MAAFQKENEDEQRPKGRLAVAAYYVYVLTCMRLVRSRLKDRCFVIRFEELNRNPVEVLTAVERWSGYSFATARAKASAGEWFDVGHIMTGNRLRKQGKVKFDPSAGESDAEAASGPKLLTSLLEGYRRLLCF